jgi:dipeptidase E
LSLTGKAAADVNVLYMGTASYDLDGPKENQTKLFVKAGCKIDPLNVTCEVPQDMEQRVDAADVIIISGGNSLFANDRWKKIGLKNMFRSAMERGAVLTGGSAGAICWFDAGHSDSWDSDSYKKKMLGEVSVAGKDESSGAPKEGEAKKEWKYIRCPALGFMPGLMCPHHDKVQSNGVLRAIDFDGMMLRHPGERGICIDHYAALVCEGENYRVLSLPGRPGSVLDGKFSPEQKGAPGMWQKDVIEGKVVSKLVPESGKLVDLLKVAESIVDDPNCDLCRAENPDDC